VAVPFRIHPSQLVIFAALSCVLVGCLAFKPDRSSVVGVRLVGSQVQLSFPPDCAVKLLRMGDLWEARAHGAAVLSDPVLVGTPPPGFRETKDDLGPTMPQTVSVQAKSDLWYGGELAHSELRDGKKHDLELSPIWNELSPAGGLC